MDRLNERIPIFPFLTSRLELVPIDRTHAIDLFKVLNDPGLYTLTGDSPPKDVETLAARYERWETRKSPDGSELWFNWVLRLRKNGGLIGHVQASVRSSQADIAWTVGTRWQRCGYATEAASAIREWLCENGIVDIRASINPCHIASIRVAEHLGLRRTTISSGTELIWKLFIDDSETDR